MSDKINRMSPATGRVLKENDDYINIAESIGAMSDPAATNSEDDASGISLLEGIFQELKNIFETVDTAKGKLAITGDIAALTILTTDASGTNFIKSGDSLYLGADATEFNANNKLFIFLNGALQEKGADAVFVTSYSFTMEVALNNGDTIMLLKQA